MPAKALSELHGIGLPYLLKHLKELTQAGIFESVSGPKGGYRLARSPEEVTFLDIVDAIDGKQPIFQCKELRTRGPLAVSVETCRNCKCEIHLAMLEAEQAWRNALRQRTIANISARMPEQRDPERAELIRQWTHGHSR